MIKKNGYLILGLICLVCAGITGGLLLRYGLQSHKQQEQCDAIAQIYHENDGPADEKAASQDTDKPQDAEADVIPSIARLQELNPDCVGWLQIPDTGLDYPVVYRDNQYYLTHNFMDERASAGAIFLDEGCNPDGDIRLLHGHHMKDGSMFGILKKYKKAEFRDAHREIIYQDGQKEGRYKVVGLLLADLTTEDYFHYGNIPKSIRQQNDPQQDDLSQKDMEKHNEDKKTYIRAFLKNALWKDADFSEKDYEKNFLLLSTCEYGTADERLVVLAVSEDD